MILLFFPSMTVLTTCHIRAALMVLGNECSCFPIWTNSRAAVVENVWFSSIVLPIVSVDTLSFVMLFIEWAPFSFKIKHVEIFIFFHLVNQSHLEFFGTVSKWTIITIVALAKVFWILCTIFWFILLWMINALNSIVWLKAIILKYTLICFLVVT